LSFEAQRRKSYGEGTKKNIQRMRGKIVIDGWREFN